MTDQFSRYEQDLIEIIRSAKTKLADQIPIAEREEKKTLLRQVTKSLDDMNTIISDMENEINKSGPNSKISMTNRLKQYKFDVDLVQKDLKRAINESTKLKSYESMGESANVNDPERRKVLLMHKSLTNASESIARSTQIAIETEDIGTEILGELNDQGDRLRNTNERLDDTNAQISRSRRLINKLASGVFYNKFLLVIIIILEILCLGGVIYWKFFS